MSGALRSEGPLFTYYIEPMRNIFAQFKCIKYSESEGIVDDTMSQSASIDEFGDGE